MQVQQAIFASTNRGPVKGYRLVAQSPGMDCQTARQLHRWSPSSLGKQKPPDWTINCFSIDREQVVVSRSVVGGPEYSGRGGRQIVTRLVVLTSSQFLAYRNDALLFYKTAFALGHLRLPLRIPLGRIEPLVMPARPLSRPADDLSQEGASPPWATGANLEGTLERAMQSIRVQERIALVGIADPRRLLRELLDRLSLTERRGLSFTTGIPPASHRPYQVHFLENCSSAQGQILESEGIQVLRPAMSEFENRMLAF